MTTEPDTETEVELWAHAADEEADHWAGPFNTELEALRAGALAHDDRDVFVIARAQWVNGEDGLPDAQTIGDVVECYVDDNFSPPEEWTKTLRKAVDGGAEELEALLKAWARKHLSHIYWCVVSGTIRRVVRAEVRLGPVEVLSEPDV